LSCHHAEFLRNTGCAPVARSSLRRGQNLTLSEDVARNQSPFWYCKHTTMITRTSHVHVRAHTDTHTQAHTVGCFCMKFNCKVRPATASHTQTHSHTRHKHTQKHTHHSNNQIGHLSIRFRVCLQSCETQNVITDTHAHTTHTHKQQTNTHPQTHTRSLFPLTQVQF
jgi:hypothetical protein